MKTQAHDVLTRPYESMNLGGKCFFKTDSRYCILNIRFAKIQKTEYWKTMGKSCWVS